MRIIDRPSDFVLKIWGKQQIRDDMSYRPLKYIRQLSADTGKLLFNMLTGELVLLSPDEDSCFSENPDLSEVVARQLIEKWFLVPDDTNDVNLSKQFTSLFQSINSIYSAPKINSFTILPTTDCNARCFYCYPFSVFSLLRCVLRRSFLPISCLTARRAVSVFCNISAMRRL